MCARIIQNVEIQALGRIYRVQTDNTDPQIPIHWNGPPGQRYAVCRVQDKQRETARGKRCWPNALALLSKRLRNRLRTAETMAHRDWWISR